MIQVFVGAFTVVLTLTVLLFAACQATTLLDDHRSGTVKAVRWAILLLAFLAFAIMITWR